MAAQTPSPPNREGLDLRGLVYGLLEFKWHALAVLVLVVCAVAAWTFRQERVFQASCSIEYDPNPPRPLGNDINPVGDPVGGILFTREFIETQNHIITSRTVAERVVQQLSLQHDVDFLDLPPGTPTTSVTVSEAAQVLQSRISVDPVRDTRIVWIRVEDRKPERAAILANAIADAYVEKTIEDRLGTTVTALEWLSSQLDSLRRQLETSELALHEFKRDNNVLSVSLEDRQNIVASDIQHFNTAMTEARTRRIALSARLNQLRAANAADPLAVRAASIDEKPRVVELRQRLETKLQERDAAALRYGPAHPSMRSLQTEIDTIQTHLRAEIDGIIRTAELDVREIQSIENGLRAALEEAHDAGHELNLREIEYSRLNRERENNSKLYDLLLERTAETDLTRMMRFTHVRIVDRALRPFRAVRPRIVFNLVLGALLGLALGLGLAFLLSRLDRRLRTAEELEDLGVQILGVVPATTPEATPARTGRRRRAVPAREGRDLLVHTRALSSFSEAIRGVRTNLTFMLADTPLRAVVVTSAGPGEGKTTIATNLATAIAQSGKRVLLIDTDLRRPRLHRVFGISSERGATTALVGEGDLRDLVHETEVDNLFVLGCGPTPPNPAELLHTERFRGLLARARESYDFVIFDSPPLGAVADAAVLAAQMDGVVLVAQADRTTRDAAAAAIRQLRDVGARYVGAVLNGLDSTSKRYGRGSYYYDRAGYYADAEQPTDERQDTSLAARSS